MSNGFICCGFEIQASVHEGGDRNHSVSAGRWGLLWARTSSDFKRLPWELLSNFWCVQEMSATFYINIFKLRASEVLNWNNE